MLYRLSYASNWGKARFRANLSHGPLPDVRDNCKRYHSGKLGRNGEGGGGAGLRDYVYGSGREILPFA